MKREGGCLCGAVRYAVEGEPRETVHCHCRMCQQFSGAAFITWATFPKSALAYTKGEPAVYPSSEYGQREFCGACGSSLVFRGARLPTVDVTAASLDAPDSVQPVANTWARSRRAWLHGFDAGLTDIETEWPGDET
jgi:hypothetical protein